MKYLGDFKMENNKENTLAIDPETGAVVINGMRIESDWTLEELEKSDAYKKYIKHSTTDIVRKLLIPNVEGKEIFVEVSLSDAKIDEIDFKFRHSQAEAVLFHVEEFIALRKLLQQSFPGYSSEKDNSGYILYRFSWGSVVARIDQREKNSELIISYKRA